MTRPAARRRSEVEQLFAELAAEERYHDVVRLSLDGQSAREIAESLGIAERRETCVRARARKMLEGT